MDAWRNVVCCASGPSFTPEQAAVVMAARRRDLCRVVVVNDNYRRVPNADILYACDGSWWAFWIERIRMQFGGELVTQDHTAAARHGLGYVEYVLSDRPLPADDSRIACGRNSGLQGMMVARQRGARNFHLFGYDCDNRGHWFGDHPSALANGSAQGFVKHFQDVAPSLNAEGIRVLNYSPTTALRCFDRADASNLIGNLERDAMTA